MEIPVICAGSPRSAHAGQGHVVVHTCLINDNVLNWFGPVPAPEIPAEVVSALLHAGADLCRKYAGLMAESVPRGETLE